MADFGVEIDNTHECDRMRYIVILVDKMCGSVKPHNIVRSYV